MSQIEYVDRRKCHRTVPMKVLCLGLGRTGTESTQRALEQLGYIETYHGMKPAFMAPWDNAMWIEALRAKYRGQGKPFGREDFDQLLGHCQAVTDAPAVLFSRELIDAYPDAKVVLTTRDVDSWYESTMEAAIGPLNSLPNAIIAFFQRITLSPFRHSKEVWDFCYVDFFDGSFENNGKRIFHEHCDMVRQLVPKDRLLEFHVQDGWEPLCTFLGNEIPPGPFPFGNEKAVLQEKIKAFMAEEARLARNKLVIFSGIVATAILLKRWWAA